jgi:hypothetical protein
MGDVGSQTFPGSDRNPAEIVAWIRNSRIWSTLVRLLVVTEGEVSWAIHEMRSHRAAVLEHYVRPGRFLVSRQKFLDVIGRPVTERSRRRSGDLCNR